MAGEGGALRAQSYQGCCIMKGPETRLEEAPPLLLQEYMGKDLLRAAGVPVPAGAVAETAGQAEEIARGMGPVAVKAQVLVGGRGKAGGIKLADTPREAYEAAQRILGMDLKGLTVRKVLVEEQQKIAKEYYAGLTLDRSKHRFILMLSSMGGVDIEEVAVSHPEAIVRTWIDPAYGLQTWQINQAMFDAGFEPSAMKDLRKILGGLYRVMVDTDAMLAEVNPLAITEEGRAIAADAKFDLDDAAIYRHPEFAAFGAESITDPIEAYAAEKGLTYVRLEGDVGIIGNGAGLVMMTLDVVKSVGGQPANFLDIGGGARADVIRNAIEVLLKDPNVKGMVINVFGGITRGDEVARGLLEAAKTLDLHVPVAIRLAGTNEEEGRKILEGSDLTPASDLVAATKAVMEQIEEQGAVTAGGHV
jgi:succinyl-CoA synthetase beta subunit